MSGPRPRRGHDWPRCDATSHGVLLTREQQKLSLEAGIQQMNEESEGRFSPPVYHGHSEHAFSFKCVHMPSIYDCFGRVIDVTSSQRY